MMSMSKINSDLDVGTAMLTTTNIGACILTAWQLIYRSRNWSFMFINLRCFIHAFL